MCRDTATFDQTLRSLFDTVLQASCNTLSLKNDRRCRSLEVSLVCIAQCSHKIPGLSTAGVLDAMKPQRIMHEADLGVDIALKYGSRQNHETFESNIEVPRLTPGAKMYGYTVWFQP